MKVYFEHPLHDFLVKEQSFDFHGVCLKCPFCMELTYKKEIETDKTIGTIVLEYDLLTNNTILFLWSGMGDGEDYGFKVENCSNESILKIISFVIE